MSRTGYLFLISGEIVIIYLLNVLLARLRSEYLIFFFLSALSDSIE